MADHLAQARACLVSAWQLHKSRPEPAIQMITVAMGGQTSAGD